MTLALYADDDLEHQPPVFFGLGRVHVLVVAAGVGSRSGSDIPKQYRVLNGKTVLEHSLAAFEPLRAQGVLGVAVVVSANDAHVGELLAEKPCTLLRCGGATRAQSVQNGLAALQHLLGAGAQDWVLVHDAARCLLQTSDVERLFQACQTHPVGGLLATPLADTLKADSPQSPGTVLRTLERNNKWLAQTPQMFRLGALTSALEQALASEPEAVTDEASAMEYAGHAPLLVAAEHPNFKITMPKDFAVAERLLADVPAVGLPKVPKFRMGEGWDVHALVPGRPLIIGGVHIPHHLGLLGHSDADVLLHAVTDALLGAAGLGDIGGMFPDTDAAFAGADSMQLLKAAAQRVSDGGWQVSNVDCTVIAQSPKLAPYKHAMAANIAACLGLDPNCVNVKAKTAEKLGPVGLEQSIEARAVLLLFV